MMQRHEFAHGCSSSDADSDTEPHIRSTTNTNVPTPTRPLTLTREFRSEPHLDVPHFLHAQDQHVSSLNKVLSGLFEVDSALSTPLSRSRKEIDQCSAPASSYLSEGYSSAIRRGQLAPPAVSSSVPLRKSSSAADWSGTSEVSKAVLAQQYHSPSDSSNGGLAMSATTVSSTGSPLAPTAESLAQHLNSSPLSVTASSEMSASNSNASSINTRTSGNHGGMFAVFGRGFFARPVIRSEEENYRYLMALDR